MQPASHPLARLSHFLHRHFIWFLLGSYLVAGLAPALGLWMRDQTLGRVTLLGATTRVTLPMLMLAWLLFNAGLGVQTEQLRSLLRRPLILAAGLAGNLLIPIAFIWAVTRIMSGWHNETEVQHILMGLALVASMPIAGSSTAWSQNANGDMTLSLGLVLISTLLSPLTTPLALHSVGLMASGEYSDQLHALAGRGAGAFLGMCVLLPSLAGLLIRLTAGAERLAPLRPGLKLTNSLNLLLLNYSNAAISMPRAFREHDWDFMAVVEAIVCSLCVLAFVSGWLIARVFGANRAQRTALMFGLGMNNNGTGLVLASLTLPMYPRVLLPIIFYNLTQHLVAGGVDFVLSRRETSAEASEECQPPAAVFSLRERAVP